MITFDNRVQVVAAAGSGKTSVMVARAAYAVHRGFVAPQRILLLAFNKAAADELQQRVQQRLASAGIDAENIRAATFHSFGLDESVSQLVPVLVLHHGSTMDATSTLFRRLSIVFANPRLTFATSGIYSDFCLPISLPLQREGTTITTTEKLERPGFEHLTESTCEATASALSQTGSTSTA